MACDLELLAEARRAQVGFVRVYGWERPTVSFGRNERTQGIFSPERLAEMGIACARRPTGGRALLHHREVTYSVALPLPREYRWQQAYQAVNLLLLRALVSLDIHARIVDDRRVPYVSTGGRDHVAPKGSTPPAAELCFSGIAQGELAVGARKLVASSVWRERGAYLQHGSIPVFDDQALLAAASEGDVLRPQPAAVLSDFMTPGITVNEAADRVELALRACVADSECASASDSLSDSEGDSVAHCGNGFAWSIPESMIFSIEATRARLERADWLWRR